MGLPRPAYLVGIFALLAMGCSSSDDGGDAKAAADPVPGSGAAPYDPNATPPPIDFGNINQTPPTPPADTPITDTDPGPSTGQVVWGVDDQNHLLRFGVQSLDKVAIKTITGLEADDLVLDIDFRPADSQLYALSKQNRIYTLDTTTGLATKVGDPFMPPAEGQGHAIDFNPVADRIRVHTDVDINLRIDPTTGVATRDTDLSFASDDVNVGQSPNLVGNAYTPGTTTTTLYAIDSTRNMLVMVPNPNDGLVKTVGILGVDVEGFVGFDIKGPDNNRLALATMRTEGKTGLFSIGLTSGAATFIGNIEFPRNIQGLAIAP